MPKIDDKNPKIIKPGTIGKTKRLVMEWTIQQEKAVVTIKDSRVVIPDTVNFSDTKLVGFKVVGPIP